MYKWKKSKCNLWLPALHLKYFGGCFWGAGGWNWIVYWTPPQKKKILDPPLNILSDHLRGRKHAPLFKIINLTKIMRTYELYHWSLKYQEVIWSNYHHLLNLCILINKTDLFFSGLNMHHPFLWQIVSQERRHKICVNLCLLSILYLYYDVAV